MNRLLRCWFIVTLSLWAVVASPASAVQPESARLDLAAIVATANDPGLEAFLHDGAFDESLEVEALNMVSYLGSAMTPQEMNTLLHVSGWERKYVSRSVLPSAQDGNRNTQVVLSYVTEYRTSSGAEGAFAVLEDEQSVETAVDLQPSRQYGEETDLTLDRGIDADNRQYQSLDLTFRIGRHVAGVEMVVYPSSSGTTPDQKVLEGIVERVEQRVSAPPEPGPGYSLARLDPAAVVTLDDAYYRLDSVDMPLTGDSAEAASARSESYDPAIAVYQLFQVVSIEPDQSVMYSLTLYAFADDADATFWLDNAPDTIARNPYYGNLQEEPIGAGSANGSLALRFQAGATGSEGIIDFALTGNVVNRVQLVPLTAGMSANLRAADQLLGIQLGCFESRSCIAVAVPAEIEWFQTTAPASPVPAATPR